jgi:dihydrofolate reductase
MSNTANQGRKIIVTEFMTLDGIMEAPEKWVGKFWGDGVGKFKHDELFGSGALLLGRKTYETFAGAWPSRQDKEGFADRMNGLPKHVASTTLKEVTWSNSKLIKGSVADEVAKLKQAPGQDIVVHGSRTLVQSLMQNGLVDQFHLLVFPIVLGSGMRLFDEGTRATLKLIESKTFDTGVIGLFYQTTSQ